MTNRQKRLAAVLEGNLPDNETLGESSDTRRKSVKRGKKNKIEKCGFDHCFVTEHDWNVQMVCCDNCDVWFHCICESLTPLEELSLTDVTPYVCFKCSGKNDRIDEMSKKILILVEEEDQMKEQLIEAQTACDDLRSKYLKVVGEKEAQLNEALEQLSVVRQAYHGNVMVGNRCLKVLTNYASLTAVIQKENPDLYSKLNESFECFSKAMKLIMERRFLENDEIEDLCQLCYKFGEIFPQHFPKRNITRKIHELVYNVPYS